MTEPRPVPYPATVRTNGWKFELDMARFKASDTWLRAKSVRTRALCLFLWAEAWGQTPAGSLPNDDELIALMLDLEAAEFAAVKPILMRGWWLAEDGRLYHHVLVERVIEMMGRRRSDSDRQAAKRARDKGRTPPDSPPNPPDSRRVTRDTGVSHTRVTPESDTEYGEGEGEKEERATPGRARVAGSVPEVDDPAGFEPTPGGRICRAIRQRSRFATCNPGDPRLLALLAQGATEDEFVGVATEAADKGKSWAWLLTVVERRRADAAAIALKPAAPVTTASDAAERTLRLIQSQQLTPEEYQASLEAKRRVLGDRKSKGVA